MVGTEEKNDYFYSFMKEVIRELEKGNDYYVFSQEQVDYLKKYFTDKKISIQFKEEIFYLKLEK